MFVQRDKLKLNEFVVEILREEGQKEKMVESDRVALSKRVKKVPEDIEQIMKEFMELTKIW